MSELACACCGERDLDHRLEPALEELQRLAGRPIEILVGYRCPRQNTSVRRLGISKLAHLQGRAADLKITGLTVAQMYALAERVPAFREGGIGVHDDGSIHVDVRLMPARWGRVAGVYLGLETSGLLKRPKEEIP